MNPAHDYELIGIKKKKKSSKLFWLPILDLDHVY